MIPKITTGASFAGLQQYLTENRDCELLDLRGASSLENAAAEMEVVAQLSSRVRSSVIHISVSAAPEDGELSKRTWIEIGDAIEQEFDLAGHQRLVIRHRDKDHDHIHISWCKISVETGRTPPKQWFRAPNAPLPELRDRAIPPQLLSAVPADQRKQYAFDRRALTRLQALCRDLEIKYGLRRLRTPQEMSGARERRESVATIRRSDRHRHDRVGSPDLTQRAAEVRDALDAPDWPTSQARLQAIGLDLEPVTRERKGTTEFRGLVIVDLSDPSNRAPASRFDGAGIRYGLRQIERRHVERALSIEEWWPNRRRPVAPEPLVRFSGNITAAAYAQLKRIHRAENEQRRAERKRLAKRHAAERARLRRSLMRLRKLRAQQLSADERRAFYSEFSRTTRVMIWNRLKARQKGELLQLVPNRMGSFAEYEARHARVIEPALPPTALSSGRFAQFIESRQDRVDAEKEGKEENVAMHEMYLRQRDQSAGR